MKKLLGILVLGLLLSGCYTATVEETVGGQFQRLNKGMSKFQVRDIFHSVIPADDPFAGGGSNCRLEYIRDKKLEILSSASRNYHFVFENVTGLLTAKLGEEKTLQPPISSEVNNSGALKYRIGERVIITEDGQEKSVTIVNASNGRYRVELQSNKGKTKSLTVYEREIERLDE